MAAYVSGSILASYTVFATLVYLSSRIIIPDGFPCTVHD